LTIIYTYTQLAKITFHQVNNINTVYLVPSYTFKCISKQTTFLQLLYIYTEIYYLFQSGCHPQLNNITKSRKILY